MYIFFYNFNVGGIGKISVLMPRQAEEVLQYDDFLGWTVSSLKDFLSLRGLKQTAFRKDKKTREESTRDHEASLSLKNQFDPRKPQDRQLTNERVSTLINGVMRHIPSACVLYSIEHTKDDVSLNSSHRKPLVSCHQKK